MFPLQENGPPVRTADGVSDLLFMSALHSPKSSIPSMTCAPCAWADTPCEFPGVPAFPEELRPEMIWREKQEPNQSVRTREKRKASEDPTLEYDVRDTTAHKKILERFKERVQELTVQLSGLVAHMRGSQSQGKSMRGQRRRTRNPDRGRHKHWSKK